MMNEGPTVMLDYSRKLRENIDRFVDRGKFSPKLRKLERAINDALETLDDQEEAQFDRLLSAALATFNRRIRDRQRFKLTAWPRSKAPGAKKTRYGWELGRGEWVDHPYRLKSQKGEARDVYVSEPYQISESGLRELVRLCDEGWDVVLGGGLSLHFPARTIVVECRREWSDPPS